jgi:type I restriction enzyme S subunit
VVIPADWKEQELSRVAEIGPGINKALSEMGTGSLYVTVEDIYHGSFLDAGRLGRIRISKSEVERFSLQVGDLVLGKSSVKRDGIGYPNLFLGCSEPVVPSGFTYRVRPDKKVLSSPFLLQYLRSRPGRKWIIDNSQSSALTNINSSIINRYPVIIPPLKEQEAIAEALSDADAAIESLDSLIAKKRDVKQAAMQQLLTGRTRLPGFTTDWKEVSIGSFTDCKAGGTPSTSVPAYWGGNIRWMSSGELNLKRVREVSGRITQFGLENSSAQLFPADSVLIGLAGQGKTRGTAAINLVSLTTNQSIAAIFPSGKHDSKFLFYVMETKYKELRDLSDGGGGRGGLNLAIIKDVRVTIPELDEQKKISEVLWSMDDELEALTEQVSKLRMVKKGMMQDLLTGKVRLV